MKVRTFAPIVIPTLNRHEHLERCIDSLKRCSGSKNTVLVIGLDYPPSEHYHDGYKKIKEYLPTIQGFKEVIILEAKSNLGVIANCARLYDYVQNQGYDRYIFTEDDNEFAPNFLEYINWGLSTYKNDQSVYAICGCKDIDTDDIRNNVYKLNTIFNAWGFGSCLRTFQGKIQYFKENLCKGCDNVLCYKLTGYIPVLNKKSRWLKVKLLKVQ